MNHLSTTTAVFFLSLFLSPMASALSCSAFSNSLIYPGSVRYQVLSRNLGTLQGSLEKAKNHLQDLQNRGRITDERAQKIREEIIAVQIASDDFRLKVSLNQPVKRDDKIDLLMSISTINAKLRDIDPFSKFEDLEYTLSSAESSLAEKYEHLSSLDPIDEAKLTELAQLGSQLTQLKKDVTELSNQIVIDENSSGPSLKELDRRLHELSTEILLFRWWR